MRVLGVLARFSLSLPREQGPVCLSSAASPGLEWHLALSRHKINGALAHLLSLCPLCVCVCIQAHTHVFLMLPTLFLTVSGGNRGQLHVGRLVTLSSKSLELRVSKQSFTVTFSFQRDTFT